MYVSVSCSGNSTTFALYTVRALLMSPMKEEMTKFAQMKPLSPQGHRSVDYKTSKCEDRSWTSSSQQRWSVLGFTQYGSSCLEKDDDDFKNLSASLYLCAAEFVQRQSAHTRVQQPASRQLNRGSRNKPNHRQLCSGLASEPDMLKSLH